MSSPAWLPPIVVCILLAGCAGGAASSVESTGPSGSAATARVTAETGSITGVVVSDENVPIPGTRIGIPSLEAAFAMADQAGAFTLNDVPPGSHAVFAEQLGYVSKAQKVTVVAGEVATVRFVLESLATPGQARQLNYVADGFVELAVVIPVYGVLYFNNTGENLNFVSYQVASDAANVVWGLTWESSAPLTGRLVRMNTVACKIASCNPQAPDNFTRALSPIVIRTDNLQEVLENREGYSVATQWYPTTCQAVSNEFCVQHPDTVTAVTAQQRYKLYTSVFFVEAAPLEFDPLP